MEGEEAVVEQVVEEKKLSKRDWLIVVEGDGEVRKAARLAGYRATHGRDEVEIQFVNMTETEAKRLAAKFGKVLSARIT